MRKSFHSRAYERFCMALKTARQKAGLTQVQAAKKLGRPQSFITKIEIGERRVDIVELADICRAYGRRLVEFVKALDL